MTDYNGVIGPFVSAVKRQCCLRPHQRLMRDPVAHR